ncbi:thromboxane A2 receptor isoform X2 [Esox lucius]|uniref:Thromboxane A2 receptor n=1 Tax=Esox lucius TaxID=8010 RepID=A0A3P9A2D1_ESOLU|nr:thromboxane A2 receptor isoform X2 [Esox lucius]
MMNLSNETTPICFSINSPPFKFNQSIGSVYYSATFSSLGLTFNLIAFVVLLKTFQRTHSRSRSSFLIFLCGLVVTDFMGLLVTGCIVVTFHITRFNWRELDPDCVFCNFMGMSMVFYGLCPLLLGATMAVERFVGINRPFSHSTRMTKSRAMYVVLLVWVVAGGVSLLPQVGVGSYHMQIPGSWCFFNISSETSDMALCLIFSLVGLLSIATSFLLNTVSVVTLVKVCCGQDASQRRRDYEVEMMVQLILIMLIASICWCPLLICSLNGALFSHPIDPDIMLLGLRMATCNQICDPWVYILCQESRLRCLLHRLCCQGKDSKSEVCCSSSASPPGTRS